MMMVSFINLCSLCCNTYTSTEPFLVAFTEPVYTVRECEDQVEVCVNLTRPQKDILDEVIHLDIVSSDFSYHITPDSSLASE